MWPFDDPAAVEGDEATRLSAFRLVRDQIAERLQAWLVDQGITVATSLPSGESAPAPLPDTSEGR